MGLHVPFQLAGLRTGMVTKMTFVWPLSRVAASMHNQIALELENLTAELTGLGFPRGLALTLCVRGTGGTVSPLRHRWLRGIGEK